MKMKYVVVVFSMLFFCFKSMDAADIPNADAIEISGSQHYFKYLFQKLFERHGEQASYRLVMIWNGGENKAYKDQIILGGNKERWKDWHKHIQNFAMAAYGAKNRRKQNVVLELFLDRETYNNHVDDINAILDDYPDVLKITMIEDLLSQKKLPEDIKLALSHYIDGNPAIVSDVLRAWYLCDEHYKTNVYMDIDTFVEKTKNIVEKKAPILNFGLEVEKPGVYYNRIDGATSNDYLISWSSPEKAQEFIRSHLIKNMGLNKQFLTFWKGRSDFVSGQKTYQEYKVRLEQIANYYISEREQRFDLGLGIMNLAGPYFWQKLRAQDDNNDYVKSNNTREPNPSDGLWKGTKELAVSGTYTCVNDLSKLEDEGEGPLKDDDIKLFIKLNHMAYDFVYAKKFKPQVSSEFLQSVLNDMKHTWSLMDHIPQLRESVRQKTLGGIKLAKEIIKDSV